jgi:hypothetical protein
MVLFCVLIVSVFYKLAGRQTGRQAGRQAGRQGLEVSFGFKKCVVCLQEWLKSELF